MPTDSAYATRALTIGEFEADPEYMFGDITSVAVDEAGRIYIADRIGSTLGVYRPDGRFLVQVGVEGDGPGEFQWPADMTFNAAGRLYVRDAHRITVLAPRVPGGVADSMVSTWRLSDYGNLNSTRSRVDSAGRYLYPRDVAARDGGVRNHLYDVYQDEQVVDSLFVPSYPNMARTHIAFYRTSASGGRIVDGLVAAPFSPVPAWDATSRATIVSSSGAEYVLFETDTSEDTLRRIRGPDQSRRPVPEDERADSARALQTRLDSLPVSLDRVENVAEEIRQGRLPEVLPAVLSIHLGTHDYIWVQRWPAEGHGDARYYDIFEPAGAFCGVVVLPAPLVHDPPPYFAQDAVYGVLRDPETDLERVVKLDLGRSVMQIGPCN